MKKRVRSRNPDHVPPNHQNRQAALLVPVSNDNEYARGYYKGYNNGFRDAKNEILRVLNQSH